MRDRRHLPAGALGVETMFQTMPWAWACPAGRPCRTASASPWSGGMLLLSGVSQLEANRLTAASCRWCEPDHFDRWARQRLRWTDTQAAGTLSTALVVAIPAGAALTLGLAAHADGADVLWAGPAGLALEWRNAPIYRPAKSPANPRISGASFICKWSGRQDLKSILAI